MAENVSRKVIIDTDPGIDDALAILMAVASPEIQVEALTIAEGNCSVMQGAINALSILELVGANHIPVICGLEAWSPLAKHKLSGSSVHGEKGLGQAHLPTPYARHSHQTAAEALIEIIMKNPHEITIVAIAPLTNLAAAIRQEPRITELVKEVFVMGGAFKTYGNNENRTAECNIYNNPYAAKVVFDSGMPITLVPLDVTRKALLTEDDVKNLRSTYSNSPIVDFFNRATQSYFKIHPWHKEAKSCVLHDPLTLSLAIQPSIVHTERLPVDVEVSDEYTLGRTIGDFSEAPEKAPNLNVALGVDSSKFINLFVERLTMLAVVQLSAKCGLKS
jgi:purine nucleosidase